VQAQAEQLQQELKYVNETYERRLKEIREALAGSGSSWPAWLGVDKAAAAKALAPPAQQEGMAPVRYSL
jgi:hypothetical protein